MKIKLYTILISLMIVISTSCSKDEGNSDPIIGKWAQVKHYVNGIEVPSYSCKPNLNQYLSDGKMKHTFYAINLTNNQCEGTSIPNLIWYKSGENYYTIKDQTDGYTSSFVALFEDNGRTLISSTYSVDPSTGSVYDIKTIYHKTF